MRYTLHLILFCCWLTILAGCTAHSGEEACLACHRGIEHTSPSHKGCVTCHGGNPASKRKDEAHRGIYALKDHSNPERWIKGCGPCHQQQLERMLSSQMYTTAGMIAQTQATWEGEQPGTTYGSRPAELYDQNGKPLHQRGVAELDNLSGELYRKFCARCHVARANPTRDGAGHPAGCAACHFPYGPQAAYRGNDVALQGRSPYSTDHTLHRLPSLNVCAQCHHRSGRTALSYQGLLDGNTAMVPLRNGQPGPVQGSDDRSYSHIAPDRHYRAGMDCIDCHTSRETMGDGYAAPDMHGQLESRCEDCHGSYRDAPRFRAIQREHEAPVRESRSYPRQMRPGMEMILTSKGRPYSNVFHVDGNVLVQLKQRNRLLRAKVITGTPEHTIAGHDRLTCSACHSRTVIQCYGCHTAYDKRQTQHDFVKGRETPGRFSEREDYRTLYPFPLAVDRSGRIAPVTPGCQTFVTVLEADGSVSQQNMVARYKGKRQLRFAPFFGHNTGDKAIGCGECHANPTFLGFGQHVVEGRSIKGTLLCEFSDNKPLDGFLSMQNGVVRAYSAITRTNARPLNQREVQRTLAVNLCLVCHSSAKDPIYRTRINYRDLDDPLHRRLLAPR